MISTLNTAAFFDLDRTLITVNSGALWVRREYQRGRISHRQMAEAVLVLVGYRLSLLDVEATLRKAIKIYRGVSEELIDRRTHRWYHEEVADKVSAEALAALEHHRQAGHLLVLLTSSSPYVAAAATEHMKLDGWISSHYEIKDGLLTGEPVVPLSYGAGKVPNAEAFALAHDIDLDRSYFYTDSYSDLPMLLRVGEPRVVNPNLRLSLYARLHGWPRLRWRTAVVRGGRT